MGGINFNTGGGSSFDPANPGPIGGTTPSTGAFTRLTVAQGTLTDPVTGLSLTATWNDAADTFRGLEFVVTDTASAAGSTPMRIMGGAAGTTELFTVFKNGTIAAGVVGNFPTYGLVGIEAGMGFRANSPTFWSNGVNMTEFQSNELRSGSGVDISWTAEAGPAAVSDLRLRRGGPGTLQLARDHATTPTAQRIQAHGVTTGTGASLTLGGGSGDTKGDVILDGGNRSVYIASPSATEIRDILISHGLMAAS